MNFVRVMYGITILLVAAFFFVHLHQEDDVTEMPKRTESSAVYVHLAKHDPPMTYVETKRVHNDLTTGKFVSPVLTELDLIDSVRTMYETSKRIRHYYYDPRLSLKKFTIVMLTYNRTVNLFQIFRHYCKMPDIIHKFVVVWHNIGTQIPAQLKDFPCNVPIVFVTPSENKLNNRFVPYEEIESECELMGKRREEVSIEDLFSEKPNISFHCFDNLLYHSMCWLFVEAWN